MNKQEDSAGQTLCPTQQCHVCPINTKCPQTGSRSRKRVKKERLLENSKNKGESEKKEGLGRGGEEETKEGWWEARGYKAGQVSLCSGLNDGD